MIEPPARLVLTSAVVYSYRFPFSTAVIIDNGMVAWIGEDEGLAGQLLENDRIFDCQGALIAPAFFDGHADAASGLPVTVGAAYARDDRSSSTTLQFFERGPKGELVLGGSAAAGQQPRYDGPLPRASLEAAITELLAARAMAVLPSDTPADVLAQLARSGVPFTFGSFGEPLDYWSLLRRCVYGTGLGDLAEDGSEAPDAQSVRTISGRAAFNAVTRGGWRLVGDPAAGEVAVGSVARLNLWHCQDLLVQTPDQRVAAWSTDVRSGTPPLPDLSPDAQLPQLFATMNYHTLTLADE